MVYINRLLEPRCKVLLDKGRNLLLLGPRQTGKTTLLKQIPNDLTISFVNPKDRLRYEKDQTILVDEIKAIAETVGNKPLIVVDEVQKVPQIMDVVQYLIDEKVAQFVLTGSSARKLKRSGDVNLLPGRLIPLVLDALSISEIPEQERNLDNLLLYGSLPEIVTTRSKKDKEELLDAYVTVYLEEEIRAEALVRNVGNFSRFLELAAAESGLTVNHSKLSQVVGVAHSTIAEYYQILEDCLIIERIEPFITSKTRHRLSKSNKYIFFDMGVRRLAAKEGIKLSSKFKGQVFEQFIGLELVKLTRLQSERTRVLYWRDLNGPEIDWVIQGSDRLIPVEVKLTDKPRDKDIKHIKTFLSEYEEASKGYVVCQAPRKMKLGENIYAVPWQDMDSIF